MSRTDDNDLGAERILYRRIRPEWLIFEDGACRPQSVAFIDRHTYEVSVFVGDMSDVGALMKDFPDQSLVGFKAALPRSCQGIVARTPENPDPAHRVLCYPNPSRMVRAAKLIATNCQWIVAPP
jgi:hypothetical protein